jgi:hypothetical protein
LQLCYQGVLLGFFETPAGAACFYWNDRLTATHTPGDAAKAARIAERFQIQKNDFGAPIFLPVLQQIIANGTICGGESSRLAMARLRGSRHIRPFCWPAETRQ